MSARRGSTVCHFVRKVLNATICLFLHSFTAGQRTPLDQVLNFIKSRVYPQLQGNKTEAERILFIITESSAFNSTAPAPIPAKTLKDNGVEVFILTVGKNLTSNLPNKVASKPFHNHVFQVSSYKDLPTLSKAFLGKGKQEIVNTRVPVRVPVRVRERERVRVHVRVRVGAL